MAWNTHKRTGAEGRVEPTRLIAGPLEVRAQKVEGMGAAKTEIRSGESAAVSLRLR